MARPIPRDSDSGQKEDALAVLSGTQTQVAHAPRWCGRTELRLHSMVKSSFPTNCPPNGPVSCVMITLYLPAAICGPPHEAPQFPPHPYSIVLESISLPSSDVMTSFGGTSAGGPESLLLRANRVN